MYNDLSIHQKITLKTLIDNTKYRTSILGNHDLIAWNALKAVKIFNTWKSVINYFLTDNPNYLYRDRI